MKLAQYEFIQNTHDFDPNNHTFSFCAPQDAVTALEDQLNMIPVSQLGFIEIKGEEAFNFLQGQLSCDINLEQMNIGAHCSDKGKVQNIYRICPIQQKHESETFVLITSFHNIEQDLKRLKKYGMFSKVEIRDVSEQYSALCLTGPEIQQYLSKNLNISEEQLSTPKNITQLKNDASPLVLLKLTALQPRYLLLGKKEQIGAFWQTHEAAFFINNSELWWLFEIRSGMPCIFQDTTNQFFPHALNLPALQGVSFEKGCYLGQEVITRMQFRGKSNHHMHRGFVTADKAPTAGNPVLFCQDDMNNSAGTVLVSSPTTNNEFELLVVVHDQYKNFMNLFINSADGPKLHHLDLRYE